MESINSGHFQLLCLTQAADSTQIHGVQQQETQTPKSLTLAIRCIQVTKVSPAITRQPLDILNLAGARACHSYHYLKV